MIEPSVTTLFRCRAATSLGGVLERWNGHYVTVSSFRAGNPYFPNSSLFLLAGCQIRDQKDVKYIYI